MPRKSRGEGGAAARLDQEPGCVQTAGGMHNPRVASVAPDHAAAIMLIFNGRQRPTSTASFAGKPEGRRATQPPLLTGPGPVTCSRGLGVLNWRHPTMSCSAQCAGMEWDRRPKNGSGQANFFRGSQRGGEVRVCSRIALGSQAEPPLTAHPQQTRSSPPPQAVSHLYGQRHRSNLHIGAARS